MNNFEEFTSLPIQAMVRIVRMARKLARDTDNRIEYFSTVEALTVAYRKRQQYRMEHAERLARLENESRWGTR